MTSGRTIGSLDTWQPEDKSFNKHVLQAGHGELTPNDGSVCIVHITAVGEIELPESDLGCYKLGTDVEVTVGEGDTYFSELLDKVVTSMKEGERCYVNCRVDVKGERISELDISVKKVPKFNVTLLSFTRSADCAELEADELLDRAEHHKEHGVALYTAGNTTFAMKRFRRALDFVKLVNGTAPPPKSVLDRAVVVRCQCELNLAACRLKTDEFQQVIEHCTEALALDPCNVKGLFRRSQALMKLGRYDEAKKDLSEAGRVEPSNKAVVSQLRAVEDLIRKEKQVYQKMFAS